MVKLSAIGGKLNIVSNKTLTTNSVNAYEIQVEFNSVWADLTKYAVFYQVKGQSIYTEVGDSNTVLIPARMLKAELPLYVGFVGENSDKSLVQTTNNVKLKVEEGANISKARIMPEDDNDDYVKTVETKIKYIRINASNEFEYSIDGNTWIVLKTGGEPTPTPTPTPTALSLSINDTKIVQDSSGNYNIATEKDYIDYTLKGSSNKLTLSPLVTEKLGEVDTLADDVTELASDISSLENKFKITVVNGISIYNNGDSLYLRLVKQNIDSGTQGVEDVAVNLADATKAGLMSTADYKSLQELVSKVARLEGTQQRLLYTNKENPIATEINAFVVGLGYTSPFANIAVVVKATNHIWHYYSNSIGWIDDGLDSVETFTNDIAGLIKGIAMDGKVYAETDGTGSVYGWAALVERVTALENATPQGDTKTLTDLDLAYGEQTVAYDSTDGLTITGKGRETFSNGTHNDINVDLEIPLFVQGDELSIDVDESNKRLVVKGIETVELTTPPEATNGTLTDSNYAKLTAKNSNILILNKELYRLDDKGHEEGFLTYSHIGVTGTTQYVKTFTITISTKAWTLIVRAIKDYACVDLNIPEQATSGSLSSEQFTILTADDRNLLCINGTEYYHLSDKGHTQGIYTYTHDGFNEQGVNKYFNLTIATKAFTITTSPISGGSDVQYGKGLSYNATTKTLTAEPAITEARGINSSLSIAVANWTASTTYSDYLFEVTATIDSLTANDSIFFTPKAFTDKQAVEQASLMAFPSDSNKVKFYVKAKPSVAISFNYHIAWGRSQ